MIGNGDLSFRTQSWDLAPSFGLDLACADYTAGRSPDKDVRKGREQVWKWRDGRCCLS